MKCHTIQFLMNIGQFFIFISFLEYDMRQDLRFIKIQFKTPTLFLVTKERAVTFVNILGEIGGTMGLLTGFSIITAVEIVYFTSKIILGLFKISIPFKKNYWCKILKLFKLHCYLAHCTSEEIYKYLKINVCICKCHPSL